MEQFTEFVGNHLYLSMIFAALLTMLIVGELKRKSGGPGQVGPIEATSMINHQNAVVLDVRKDDEYSQGAIVNAIHIPLEEIDNQLKKIEKYKDKSIIVYCRTGSRSVSACSKLKKQGFDAVFNLGGGVMAWQKDNLPLVKTGQ